MAHEEFNFEGKIIVFKTLTLPKIVHLCLTSIVPKQIIEEIENIQKNSFRTDQL